MRAAGRRRLGVGRRVVQSGLPDISRAGVLALLLAVSAASAQTDGEATAPQEPSIAVSGAADDAAIASRIRGILGTIDGYEDVTVSVREGVVNLGGTVADRTASERAAAISGRVAGVVTV